MSLSTAFNVISSSFAANASQTATVSNNIANVNTPSYSREIANVVTNSYGGSDVASITREANAALLEQVSSSTSQAAAQQAISDGLTTLAQTVDDSSSTTSTSGADQNGDFAFRDARQPAKRAHDLRRIRRARRPLQTRSCRPPPTSPRH